MTPEELMSEAARINGKLAAAVDGEDAYPTLYAAIALVIHCASEANVPLADALTIFRRALHSHGRSK